MAFAGMFIMFMGVALVILGGCTLIGIILLIIAGVLKKKKKHYVTPMVVGIVFMMPLFLTICLTLFIMVSSGIDTLNSLPKQVNRGYYEYAELMLERGAEPDCTIEDNNPPEDGGQTLLSSMCENGGFVDDFGDPVDDVVTQEELDMIQLLIDHGADLESRSYKHRRNHPDHTTQNEHNIAYNISEQCGYTPLMYAVHNGHFEIVKLLVENGADVNAKSYCGYNVVHIIVDNLEDEEGAEMLQYLLDHGAIASEVTNYGHHALILCFQKSFYDSDFDNDEIYDILYEGLLAEKENPAAILEEGSY